MPLVVASCSVDLLLLQMVTQRLMEVRHRMLLVLGREKALRVWCKERECGDGIGRPHAGVCAAMRSNM